MCSLRKCFTKMQLIIFLKRFSKCLRFEKGNSNLQVLKSRSRLWFSQRVFATMSNKHVDVTQSLRTMACLTQEKAVTQEENCGIMYDFAPHKAWEKIWWQHSATSPANRPQPEPIIAMVIIKLMLWPAAGCEAKATSELKLVSLNGACVKPLYPLPQNQCVLNLATFAVVKYYWWSRSFEGIDIL